MKKLIAVGNFVLALLMITFIGCQKSDVIVDPAAQNQQEALKQLIEEDETLSSFEPNYTDDDVSDFILGKTNTLIYPVKVGQKMLRSSFNMDVTFEGDTAYATLIKTFTGKLYIAASYDEWAKGDSNIVDTLIEKDFTSTMTRKVNFLKTANTDRPRKNWKVIAMSLPEGGTMRDNIQINKMTIILADGSTIEVNNPNEYFLTREAGMKDQIPFLNRGDEVTVQLEVQSAYADTDYVYLAHGANKMWKKREKKRFELIDEVNDGVYYQKTYSQTWRVGRRMGHFHAVVNAIPYQVLKDDAAPVEENSWGMPYRVK